MKDILKGYNFTLFQRQQTCRLPILKGSGNASLTSSIIFLKLVLYQTFILAVSYITCYAMRVVLLNVDLDTQTGTLKEEA